MTDEEELEELYKKWMSPEVRFLDEDRWAAIMPLMFTGAIVVGYRGDTDMYHQRWCYSTVLAATAALRVWDGKGEPVGWHRNPVTGERVSRSPDEIGDDGKRVGAVGVRYTRW